jgi:mycothiol synthase
LLLPEGITWRPLTRDDGELAAELINEDERWLGRTGTVEPSDIRSWWLRADLDAGSWLLSERGEPIALGWVEVHDGVGFGGSCVRPGAKGRGLGALLVRHAEAIARELGASRVLQHAPGEDHVAHALFESSGYRAARRHYEMVIEMDAAPPDPPGLPDGLVVDRFRAEDAQEFHDAIGEAFADEWGFVALPFERWWEMRKGDDHSLWWVVRDGERIAAYARCEAGRGGGFVGMLGVRRAYRRSGLGLALLLEAFGEFWQRGMRRATLGVDSENPTGATRLYERAGMHVESTDVTYEKDLT